MRRNEPPYSGRQFILNKATGEIHDLEWEMPECRISEIRPDDIFSCDTYAEAVLFASVLGITRTDVRSACRSITGIDTL